MNINKFKNISKFRKQRGSAAGGGGGCPPVMI
jgi:hypothetical protein